MYSTMVNLILREKKSSNVIKRGNGQGEYA